MAESPSIEISGSRYRSSAGLEKVAAGMLGVSRRHRINTTVRVRNARPAPDLVERNFTAAAPKRWWVAHISYHLLPF